VGRAISALGLGMAGKLNDRMIKAVGEGRYDDGDGLRLVVAKSKSKSWVLRFQKDGVRRDMGLGAYPGLGLAEARKKAAHLRERAAQGVDIIAEKNAPKRSLPTFGEVATLVIADMQSRSSNEKVRYQAARHLGPAYCNAILDRPVSEISTTDVAAMLRPVWREKPEVARKLYPAVRRVFDRARVILKADFGIVVENPALWADLKAQGFDPPKALSRGSHPSLAYARAPEFFASLRTRSAMAAKVLEVVILTNVRTDAALKAEWREFDLEAGLWTVPLARLKDRKHRKVPFRVPLSPRAIELLRELERGKIGEHAFPGARGKPLSNMAMLTLLRRMNATDGGIWKDDQTGRPIVVHGFRATFRTWAEENAKFPHAIVEDAMGHAVGNVAERAYRRTDMLEARRGLMTAWAQWCEPRETTNILRFPKEA
jgi:integrase